MSEICPICGTEKEMRPAGVSKKTGRPYSAFWSCPNFKNHSQEKPERSGNEKATGDLMLLEEIQSFRKEVNERLDSMGKWLALHIK